MYTYKVIVRTGNIKDAGTDARIYIDIYGSKANLLNQRLSDPNDKDDFEAGDVNRITLLSPNDLGEIEKITIWHDNSGKKAGWYLDYVEIQKPSGPSWTFGANRWLAKDEGDGKLCITLYSTTYNITVYTGDVDGGGTDANVYITLYGSKGNSGEKLLDISSHDDFERGRFDKYTITTNDIGDIQKIKVRHDDSDKNAGWFLDGVRVSCPQKNKQWNFPFYQWLAKDEGNRQIEAIIPLGNEMVHYEYLNNYPMDRENGFSHEINGVCHDDKYWYFSQNESSHGSTGGTLWKIPATMDLNSTFSGNECGVQKCKHGGHFGDIDYYENYIFAPITTESGSAKICVFSADVISKEVASQELYKTIFSNSGNVTSKVESVAFVAIKNGLLFTNDRGVCADRPILVYSIDMNAIKKGSGDFLKPYANLYLNDEEGNDLERGWMQGGCFDNKNHLHLTNGSYKGDYANSKGGITVYEVPNLKYGDHPNIRVLTKSNQTHDFEFKFSDLHHEPEGITYWDLDAANAPKIPNKKIQGQLHAIVMDGKIQKHEDLYFKHFRKV